MEIQLRIQAHHIEQNDSIYGMASKQNDYKMRPQLPNLLHFHKKI
jgi:hypothetical protein